MLEYLDSDRGSAAGQSFAQNLIWNLFKLAGHIRMMLGV